MFIAQPENKEYYAVIFTSILNDEAAGYSEMAQKMEELAKDQPGYLGIESAREGLGITISYCESEEDITNWKANADHIIAQKTGKENRLCRKPRAKTPRCRTYPQTLQSC